jgi:hypothetical protein
MKFLLRRYKRRLRQADIYAYVASASVATYEPASETLQYLPHLTLKIHLAFAP